jgi:hypothetical protein
MSAAREALRAAVAAGVHVSIDGESLVLEAASEPPKALIKALKKHKTKILSLLKAAARDDRLARPSQNTTMT